MNQMPFEFWLQSRLTAHGFPVGPIDGVIGPVTIAALKAFEARHGLDTDGTADPMVVQALRATSSTVTPKEMVAIPNRDIPADIQLAISNKWPREADCMAYYGAVGTNQKSVEVPFDFFLAWSKSTRVKRITVNAKVADSVERVFEKLAQFYSRTDRNALGIDLFGGSLNVRKKRGGNNYSMHSWGIALDFDPERNQLSWKKPQARLSASDALPFWKAWEDEGWLSLGRARNFDWMHVQAARL